MESTSPLTETNTDPVEAILGKNLLLTLEKMKAVKLDTKFLDDSVYKSLVDLSVEVPSLPAGRRDPFAPIGSN